MKDFPIPLSREGLAGHLKRIATHKKAIIHSFTR